VFVILDDDVPDPHPALVASQVVSPADFAAAVGARGLFPAVPVFVPAVPARQPPSSPLGARMSNPVPSLSVSATPTAASYAPGSVITIDVSALALTAVVATVSATLGEVTVNATADFSLEEPASGASFGISDTAGLSWSQAPGSAPGSVVFTATAPAA
jgi:hypothetical protein